MITKTTERAIELFQSIKKRNGEDGSLVELIEEKRVEWEDQGKEFLPIEEIDSVIMEVRNGR